MSLSTGYSSTLSQPNFRHNDADNFVLEHLHSDARAVLDFWFDTANKPFWFDENDEFDQKIRDKFSGLWQAAIRGKCASWRRAEAETSTNNAITSLAGRLAEIIVIDQHDIQQQLQPQGNRLVIFNSNLVHQVAITHRERFSIATWMRKDGLISQ